MRKGCSVACSSSNRGYRSGWAALAIAAFAVILFAVCLVPPAQAAGPQTTIPPGTRITMQNWRQYQQFMPAGMADLFAGKFFWKLPADVEIDVGPTSNVPLPPTYVAATEKHRGQVQVVHLANGHNDIRNYEGGLPFPNAQAPDKGYKVMVNAWFSYRPHLNVATLSNPVRDCTVDRYNNRACETTDLVYRQVDYNTDPGVQVNQSPTVWYTEWLMVEEPEQAKYTAQLTLFYKNNQRFQDEYVFIPSLRRSMRLSSSARCSPLLGTDFTQDDYQVSGFNGGIALFDAKYLGHKKIIALTGFFNYKEVGHNFPNSAYQPLLFPPPSWGKWQVRDVDVIDIQRIPSERSGYCYGKRIMYLDSYYHTTHWQDLYDSNMKLWKIALYAVPDAAKVPGVPGGRAPGLGGFATMWDIQNDHLTIATSLGEEGQSYMVNSDAPKQYHSYNRYSTPGGLDQIMR